MSPDAIPIVGGMLTYDFMSSDSYRDITSFGQKQLANGTSTLQVATKLYGLIIMENLINTKPPTTT